MGDWDTGVLKSSHGAPQCNLIPACLDSETLFLNSILYCFLFTVILLDACHISVLNKYM